MARSAAYAVPQNRVVVSGSRYLFHGSVMFYFAGKSRKSAGGRQGTIVQITRNNVSNAPVM